MLCGKFEFENEKLRQIRNFFRRNFSTYEGGYEFCKFNLHGPNHRYNEFPRFGTEKHNHCNDPDGERDRVERQRVRKIESRNGTQIVKARRDFMASRITS